MVAALSGALAVLPSSVVSRHIRYLLAQVIGVHMRIALGSGDAGVTQEFLHRAQVGACAQGMGGKGVAQQMRPRAIGDAEQPSPPAGRPIG